MKILEKDLKQQVRCWEAKPGVYKIDFNGDTQYTLVSKVRSNGKKVQTMINLSTMEACNLDYFFGDRYYEFITDSVNIIFTISEEKVLKM